MDEIVKMVAERVGISQEQASSAVEIVAAQLKDKLPGPIGDQIEGVLGSGGDGEGGVEDKLKGLGGRFGL